MEIIKQESSTINLLLLSDRPLFPGGVTTLVISRQEEIHLVEQLAKSDSQFGVVLINDSPTNLYSESLPNLYPVGTMCKVNRYVRLPNGTLHVFVSTLSSFFILSANKTDDLVEAEVKEKTDEEINQKIIRLLECNIVPILCVGETKEEREKINEHIVVTIDMLKAIHFPKELSKVVEYAGAHHERIDGKGVVLRGNAAQLARGFLVHIPFFQQFRLVDNLTDITQKFRAVGGESDTLCRATENLYAQFRLEFLDGGGQAGLRHEKLPRRLGYGAALRYFDNVSQLLNGHASLRGAQSRPYL